MDLIGATLKYEMDLRDLRAAENLSQSKLLFFFGPQACPLRPPDTCPACAAGAASQAALTALSPQPTRASVLHLLRRPHMQCQVWSSSSMT